MPVADRSKAAIPVRVKVAVPQAEEGVYLKPDMIAMVSFLNEPSVNTEKTAPGHRVVANPPSGGSVP